jgi:hypothetical protein
MSGAVTQLSGVDVFLFDAAGGPVRTDRDAADLLGDAMGAGAAWAAVPAARLGEDFFRLETRIAGEVIQKFVNYRIGLAVVGDIAEAVTRSTALRDFVYESNRGRHVWFVADLEELDAKLAQAARK